MRGKPAGIKQSIYALNINSNIIMNRNRVLIKTWFKQYCNSVIKIHNVCEIAHFPCLSFHAFSTSHHSSLFQAVDSYKKLFQDFPELKENDGLSPKFRHFILREEIQSRTGIPISLILYSPSKFSMFFFFAVFHATSHYTS